MASVTHDYMSGSAAPRRRAACIALETSAITHEREVRAFRAASSFVTLDARFGGPLAASERRDGLGDPGIGSRNARLQEINRFLLDLARLSQIRLKSLERGL
jgi:hypothetical protein